MKNKGAVKAWEAPVTIPTYPALPPDRNPMFLDKRVYQGSSGKVYPNPFTDRVSDEKVDKSYNAVHLENEYIRVMILPEIGGRIHIGQDKINGYDFIYRQNVIKPALVGLLGPWISGGVEFNWPQHHRPSTFMPVDHFIEEHEDGSRTVWLSEHEPMNRMKGMAGICLYPGKALIEAKVRLYNRTPFVQTFLWWANAGIRVHDQYQAFFPPDVHFVADHAKRAMSWYPVARNFYYGVDYRQGVDIAWYKNIPVPTSYMVTKSDYDFFGGYDHEKQAGIVHVADHHVAPGKKLWTWGNAEFGYAWDRELTDEDGPYIELMAGAYTDNQPDFSFLQPYETKTFRQVWYPIRKLGPVKNANRLVAVNLEAVEGGWKVGIAATEKVDHATVVLSDGPSVSFERQVSLAPGEPFVDFVPLAGDNRPLLRVLGSDGGEIIRYQPVTAPDMELPEPAAEPPPPAEIVTNEELYLTGLHLDQYRHATREPQAYWSEALRRDAGDARCNNAMGLVALRQGRFRQAEEHFGKAISRLTRRNPNPRDGEPHYNLGVALRYQNRTDEAYAAFQKAAWNGGWVAAACYELAAIDCTRGENALALQHLERSLRADADNLKARNLRAAALRKLGRSAEARTMVEETIALDPLDFWSRYELLLLNGGPREGFATFFEQMRRDQQTCLDIAFDCAWVGLLAESADLLTAFQNAVAEEAYLPTLHYALGWVLARLGRAIEAAESYTKGRRACPDYCFPARLEELLALEAAASSDPADAQARYLLGNLLYDKRRREEAIELWEESARLDPAFPITWRNLGIAYYNVRGNSRRAAECYQAARKANPSDARLLYECDQLRKRTNVAPDDRLRDLEVNRDLVARRDDLSIELVTLYNQTGRSNEALKVLMNRRFHPWEGGEGLVSGQYVAAHLLLGRDQLEAGDPAGALSHFQAARSYPPNLGEGKHLLTPETHLDYFTGVALTALGRTAEAQQAWQRAANAPAATDVFAYYRALALNALGRQQKAQAVLNTLRNQAETQLRSEAGIDYFATSLPNFLIFEDDISLRNRVEHLVLRGFAQLGLGRYVEASADLGEALSLDRNHLFARMEMDRMPKAGKQKIQDD